MNCFDEIDMINDQKEINVFSCSHNLHYLQISHGTNKLLTWLYESQKLLFVQW